MRIDSMAHGINASYEWRRLNDPVGIIPCQTLDNWHDIRHWTIVANPNRLPRNHAQVAQGRFLNDARPSLCYVANPHPHLLEWELPAIKLSW